MNKENNWNGVVPRTPVNMALVNEISLDEVKMAVQDMENEKAVGPDAYSLKIVDFIHR